MSVQLLTFCYIQVTRCVVMTTAVLFGQSQPSTQPRCPASCILIGEERWWTTCRDALI